MQSFRGTAGIVVSLLAEALQATDAISSTHGIGRFFARVLEWSPMPSETYGRSIRNLLLVIVFQLGLGIFVLAEVLDAARGYETVLSPVVQLIGGVTAVGALVVLYRLEQSVLANPAE